MERLILEEASRFFGSSGIRTAFLSPGIGDLSFLRYEPRGVICEGGSFIRMLGMYRIFGFLKLGLGCKADIIVNLVFVLHLFHLRFFFLLSPWFRLIFTQQTLHNFFFVFNGWENLSKIPGMD